jgi:hypothetical protein
VGEEGQVAAGGEIADGEDVPSVLGDDADHQEVDLFGGVADFGGAAAEVAGSDVVGTVEIASGGLYLDAPELVGAVAIGVEDEVVGFAVAVGLGGGESEGNSFVEESDFDQFSIAFRVADGAGQIPKILFVMLMRSHKWRKPQERGAPFSLLDVIFGPECEKRGLEAALVFIL